LFLKFLAENSVRAAYDEKGDYNADEDDVIHTRQNIAQESEYG
jgi:hypothetical protein